MSATRLRDEAFMRECLRLARKGRSFTAPNPMVGAVVVYGGRIISRGWHRRYGAPHAEVEALARAGLHAKGATLYVNLEPCRHFGKTPPCTEAILRAGIARVVCAARDPNGLAHGGFERLCRAGISVSIGILEKEARELNEAFYTFYEKGRPFIALKFAASLDGKLATRTGDSKWITNKKARSFARALRGEYQAVLVGINTVIKDDPHLGVRQNGTQDPLRIILDSKLRIPLDAKVLRDSHVLIATTAGAPKRKKKLLETLGVSVRVLPGTAVSIQRLLALLKKAGIISVLVEGGGEVLASFLDARAVDKVYAFYAPTLLGGGRSVSIGGEGIGRVSEALRLQKVFIKRFQDNHLVSGSLYTKKD